jgi:hypothetical protein
MTPVSPLSEIDINEQILLDNKNNLTVPPFGPIGPVSPF